MHDNRPLLVGFDVDDGTLPLTYLPVEGDYRVNAYAQVLPDVEEAGLLVFVSGGGGQGGQIFRIHLERRTLQPVAHISAGLHLLRTSAGLTGVRQSGDRGAFQAVTYDLTTFAELRSAELLIPPDQASVDSSGDTVCFLHQDDTPATVARYTPATGRVDSYQFATEGSVESVSCGATDIALTVGHLPAGRTPSPTVETRSVRDGVMTVVSSGEEKAGRVLREESGLVADLPDHDGRILLVKEENMIEKRVALVGLSDTESIVPLARSWLVLGPRFVYLVDRAGGQAQRFELPGPLVSPDVQAIADREN